MTLTPRPSALLGAAFGLVLGAPTSFAGPGCGAAGVVAPSCASGCRLAVYRPAPDAYTAAHAYHSRRGYGAHHGINTQRATQADIVDTAIAAGNFEMLVTAVRTAELVEPLKGEGPYTLFAPTDAAFAKLPKAQREVLFRDKAALAKILAYHVVRGKVTAAEVMQLTSAATVEGQPLTITAGDGLMINNALVIETDIEGRNGVIHAIDSLMLPPDMVTQL